MADPVSKASQIIEIMVEGGKFIAGVINRFGETPAAVGYIKDRTSELERFEAELDEEIGKTFPSRDDGSSEEED